MTDVEYVDVSFSKDGGVEKKILKAAPDDAEGPPPNGTVVTAHYTGEDAGERWKQIRQQC